MKLYKSEAPKIVSDFAQEFNFDELRPYYDNESDDAMRRMITYDPFYKAMAYLWPQMEKSEIIEKTLSTKSPCEFQTKFMSEAIWKIINSTSTGLTWSGIEQLDKNKS